MVVQVLLLLQLQEVAVAAGGSLAQMRTLVIHGNTAQHLKDQERAADHLAEVVET